MAKADGRVAPEELSLHVPPIGVVSTTLRQESATLFRFLRDTGEINRLKNLDHLGAIRFALEGAHHPRWEYIAVILALCDRSAESPEVHLKSSVSLAPGLTLSSGQELLKCWSMLLNVGHLTWTFTAERALLYELWRNREFRMDFQSNIDSDGAVQAWAGRLLKEGRNYQLFQALAFFRIRHLADAHQLPLQREWLALLRAYVLETARSQQVARLRAIYREIRRVAYMGLDAHYTPSVVMVDAHQLFTNVATLANLVTREVTRTEDQLASVERHLYRDVYLSEPVLRAIAARESSLRRQIRQHLRNHGVSATIEALASGELQNQVSEEPLSTVVRVPVFPVPPFEQILLDRVNPRIGQARFERNLGRLAKSVRVELWDVPFGSEWILQLHVPPDDRRARSGAYHSGFLAVRDLKKEANRWLDYVDETSLHEYLFESLASNLLVGALELLPQGAAFRWEWSRIRDYPVAILASRSAGRKLLREMIGRGALEPDIQAELAAEASLLRYRPREYAAVAAARLIGYRLGARKPSLELDGLLVEAGDDGSTRITLVETKKRASGSKSDSRAHLEKSLSKLGLKDIVINVVTEGRVTRAWAVITVRADGGMQ